MVLQCMFFLNFGLYKVLAGYVEGEGLLIEGHLGRMG